MHTNQPTSVQPSVGVNRCRGGLWVVVVPEHQLRSTHTDLSVITLYAVVHVHQLHAIHIASFVSAVGLLSMRVDLSPRLGDTQWPNQPPHYCPPLIHLHSPPRNGVRSHSRCGTES